MEEVRIERKPLVDAEISPLQYGQFVEYLCNLIPAMWAEKLYDGSFEGLGAYQHAFLKETDFQEKPWYPSEQVNRAVYSLDSETKVSGKVSQKIEVKEGAPCTVGLSQDGIALAKDEPLLFSCWLRQSGLNGPVLVRLHHEGKVYASCEFHPTGDWQKVTATLLPTAADANSTLTISFRGPAALWLDNASLMPTDTVGGWRRDVVEATRALKPGIIRFGGSTVDEPSMSDFHWKDTIGDPDRRRPFYAWGGLQPTGPGLEEILAFCREVGAEPLICVAFRNRTPQEAAEQVQYFNGPTSTPLGALRAANGHPEPYGIRWWQIGNEINDADYAERLPEFCRAMRAEDPSIKLMCSYAGPDRLQQAGDLLDYICPHHYSEDLAAMEADLNTLRKAIAEYAPGRNIRVGVTEWNTTGGHWGVRRAMLWTLANALACSRYHNLLHRHCDLVEIANRSNLINSLCSGVLQTDNHRLYKTPTYYAQQLYATQAGNRPLRITSSSPANFGLDISATLSADDKEITLFAVNDTLDESERWLDFSGFGGAAQEVVVWTLTDTRRAGEPDVFNSFTDPERIRPIEERISAPEPQFAYTFPPLSLTVLKWRVIP